MGDDEWFENPLDRMPIAKEPPSWEDTAPSEYEPPDDDYKPSEFADLDWFTDEKPKEEEKKTMHQKMYEIATAKYNPFAVGGSESLNNIGGSENHAS